MRSKTAENRLTLVKGWTWGSIASLHLGMYGHGQRVGEHWCEECSKELISIPLSAFCFSIFWLQIIDLCSPCLENKALTNSNNTCDWRVWKVVANSWGHYSVIGITLEWCSSTEQFDECALINGLNALPLAHRALVSHLVREHRVHLGRSSPGRPLVHIC